MKEAPFVITVAYEDMGHKHHPVLAALYRCEVEVTDDVGNVYQGVYDSPPTITHVLILDLEPSQKGSVRIPMASVRKIHVLPFGVQKKEAEPQAPLLEFP